MSPTFALVGFSLALDIKNSRFFLYGGTESENLEELPKPSNRLVLELIHTNFSSLESLHQDYLNDLLQYSVSLDILKLKSILEDFVEITA